MENKEVRTLERVCGTDVFYHMQILGNTYCQIAIHSNEVVCKYLSQFEDHNGIRRCLNPHANDRDYEADKYV